MRNARFGSVGRLCAVLAAVVTVVAACSSSGGAKSDDSPAGGGSSIPTVTLIVSSANVAFLPVWTALWDGSYQKAGVNVSISVVPNASELAALVSGRGDIEITGVGSALVAVNSGQPTSVIYMLSTNVSPWVLGTKNVKTVNDCTTMLAGSAGSTTSAWAIELKDLFHAKFAIRNVTQIESVGPAALAGGTADCAMGNTLFSTVSSGLTHVVLDPVTSQGAPQGFPKGVPDGSFFGLTKTLQSKKGAIERFLKGYYDSLTTDFLKKTPAELAQVAHAHSAFAPESVAELTSDIKINQPLFSTGYITSADWASTLKIESLALSYVNATDAQWSYGQRVDMSYYDAAIGTPKGS